VSAAVTGRVAGKVAFITGAGRGQGRSHAIRLAEEGADIIAVDICQDYATVGYGMATPADLAETVKAVEALDRRIIASPADVRDAAALKAAVDDGVAQLGRLDIVCANAGICTIQSWDEVTPQVWQDTLDTNLTGVWNTMVAATPHLIAAGGGSIICTSSTAGIKGLPYLAPYVAAKHGVVGIAKTMANELAVHKIRVNTVHPTGVDTPMGSGLGGLEALIARDPNLGPIYMNALPVESVQPRDISHAVLFLASDEAQYVTGLEFTVDAGNTIRLSEGELNQWQAEWKARSPSSPGPRAARAAATRSGWPKKAPTSSRWTGAARSARCPTAWPRRRTWPRPSRTSRRWTAASWPARPTSATTARSRPPSMMASRSSVGWTSCRPTPASSASPRWRRWATPSGRT
jgi:SDR family mycofactocin-dependent oxidoreductase